MKRRSVRKRNVFPLMFEVSLVRRVVTTEVDELGNDVVDEHEVVEPVAVAGWAQPAGAEPVLVGHDRRAVEVQLFAPVGVFKPLDAVRLPDRPDDLLEVVGEPANYEHNPFGWSPGLEVVNLAHIN